MNNVGRLLLAIGLSAWPVSATAEVCTAVDNVTDKVVVMGTAAAATASAVRSSASVGFEQAKDGTVRVMHSSGKTILKNRHGRYLPGTWSSAADQTKQVVHRTGQAITKNVRGKYLPGTLTSAKEAVVDTARNSSRYLGSKGGRKAAVTGARQVAGVAVRYGGTAAAVGTEVITAPVVIVASTVAVAGAAGAYVYCNPSTIGR